jgi:hypothetical protein
MWGRKDKAVERGGEPHLGGEHLHQRAGQVLPRDMVPSNGGNMHKKSTSVNKMDIRRNELKSICSVHYKFLLL